MISDEKKIYLFLCLGCITISFNVGAMAAVLPSISSSLGVSDVLVSRIIPGYMVPYGLGALLYAPMTRFFSYRSVLGITLAVYGLASLYCAQAGSLGHLLAARVVTGLSGASVIPLALVILGRYYGKLRRGRLVGLLFSLSFVSSIMGILLSGIGDWRWLFVVPAVLGLCAAAGISLGRTSVLGEVLEARVNYVNALRDRSILKLFVFIFLISAFYHGVYQWFGIFLSRTYHLGQGAISTLFIMMSLSAAAGQIWGGFIADRKGRYEACRTGLLILSLSVLLLGGSYPLGFLLPLLLCVSAGWTIGHTGISTLLTDFSKKFLPEMASLNSSVRFIAGGLGLHLSSYFVGKSFTATFFVVGLMMGLLFVLLKKFLPPKKRLDLRANI